MIDAHDLGLPLPQSWKRLEEAYNGNGQKVVIWTRSKNGISIYNITTDEEPPPAGAGGLFSVDGLYRKYGLNKVKPSVEPIKHFTVWLQRGQQYSLYLVPARSEDEALRSLARDFSERFCTKDFVVGIDTIRDVNQIVFLASLPLHEFAGGTPAEQLLG